MNDYLERRIPPKAYVRAVCGVVVPLLMAMTADGPSLNAQDTRPPSQIARPDAPQIARPDAPQIARPDAPQRPDPPQPENLPNPVPSVRLTLQGEIPLADLIEYVAQRLSIRVVYDAAVRQKKVNLVAPDPIPIDSLQQILESILVNEGLVISDADQRGIRRITTSDQITQIARTTQSSEDLDRAGDATAVTRVFVLKEARPSIVSESIASFLSQSGANAIPLDRSRLLVVTDIASNIRRIESLIDILDGAQTQIGVEFISANNVAVERLANQLQTILAARAKAMGMDEQQSGSLAVTVDSRTNRLILIGTQAEITEAKRLLEMLDRPLDTQRRVFNLRFFSPRQLDLVVRDALKTWSPSPPYQSRVEGSSLIVDSTPDVLELVQRSQQQLDTREAPDSQSPIRFYKIKNVPAQELIETINGISGHAATTPRRRSLPRRSRTTNDSAIPGPNQSPLDYPSEPQAVQIPLTPPAMRQENAESISEPTQNSFPLTRPQDSSRSIDATIPEISNQPDPGDADVPSWQSFSPRNLPTSLASRLIQAEVTVDVHSNTIIVVAPPDVQRVYASLIEQLDQRRPQVLVEAQVVIIDTSDDYTLGVEISGGDRFGAKRFFSFSSFGLSTVDPVSGSLSIIPGIGFNGTLVDPQTADAVVRALVNHRRARVLSAPRILVNDNTEGQLTSVIEVPFTSVNASQTVATTSFAGFAEAGTTITVTPTISDDHYLNVDYVVTLNSFTGAGTEGVPPPRQTNEVRSRVTVPDGYTVIVGGLTSKNGSYRIDSIPLLERIPIIRELSSLQTTNWQQTSLFVFLKPIILREDKFKDLRFLSEQNLDRSGQGQNFPSNSPILIE